MLLSLWTQSSEKPYRFFKHIISGWGFKNITNHLKVLVQCGSIVPGSWGPIYRLGHCKKFPVNSMTTLYQQVFFMLLLLEQLKSTPMLETEHFLYWNELNESCLIISAWVQVCIKHGTWSALFPRYPVLLKMYLFFVAVTKIWEKKKKRQRSTALWRQIKTCSYVKVLMLQFNK